MGIRQNIFYIFEKKEFKVADSKKLRLDLGLVRLIDANGIDVGQPLWLKDCPT